jgi:hypothetical protein
MPFKAKAKTAGWGTIGGVAIGLLFKTLDFQGRVDSARWFWKVISRLVDTRVLVTALVFGVGFLIYAYWDSAIASILSRTGDRKRAELQAITDKRIQRAMRRHLKPRVTRLSSEIGVKWVVGLLSQQDETAKEFLAAYRNDLTQLDDELLECNVAAHIKERLQEPFDFGEIAHIHQRLLGVLRVLGESDV